MLAGEQLGDGYMLEHSTLEVLVLTRCWGGEQSFALRYTVPASSEALHLTCVHLPGMALLGYGFGLSVCHPMPLCRCRQLRTLVFAMDDLPDEWGAVMDFGAAELFAALPALAVGAPGLRALQLVLPMLDGGAPGVRDEDLGPLWRGLEALHNLMSLTLGWVFMKGKASSGMGERIASVLDLMQVGPAALWVCLCDI